MRGVLLAVLVAVVGGGVAGQENKRESPDPKHPALVRVTKFNPDGSAKWTRESWAYFRDDKFGVHIHFYGNISMGGLNLGGDSLTVGDLVVDPDGKRWKIIASGKKTKFGSTAGGIPLEKLSDPKK